jgi:hypothetical protein
LNWSKKILRACPAQTAIGILGMNQNERVIVQSLGVGLALLVVIFVVCAYLRWY